MCMPTPPANTLASGRVLVPALWKVGGRLQTHMCYHLMDPDWLVLGLFLLYIYSNKIMQQYSVCTFVLAQHRGQVWSLMWWQDT